MFTFPGALTRRKGRGGLGLPAFAPRRPDGVAPTLPYDPVVIVMGDSQSLTEGDDTAAAAFNAAYAANPKIKALDAAGALVPYAPGTLTGMISGTNTPKPGPEIGFVAKFATAYPNNELTIFKYAAGGSFNSRPPNLATFTGSISGNILTFTGTLNDGEGLLGSGVQGGTYAAFGTGTAGKKYVYIAGQSANPNLAVATTTMTRYNIGLGWPAPFGLLFWGPSNAMSTGWRARVLAGLASMTAAGRNPKIVAVILCLGTNDATDATAGGLYGSANVALIAQMKSAWPLAGTKIIMPRVRSTGTASATVRAAQLSNANADAALYLFNTDDLSLSDGIHFTVAARQALGERAYDIWSGASNGL